MAKGARLHLRLTDEQKVAFDAAAETDELSVSEWLRQLGTRRVEELEAEKKSTPRPPVGFVPGVGLSE